MIRLVLMGLVVVDVMLEARLMVRACLTRKRDPRIPTAWEMLLWRSFPVTRRLGLLPALPVLVLLVRFPPRGFLRTFLAREACVCGVCLYPTFSWIFSEDFLLRKRLFWAEIISSGSADGDGEVSADTFSQQPGDASCGVGRTWTSSFPRCVFARLRCCLAGRAFSSQRSVATLARGKCDLHRASIFRESSS